MSLQNKLAQAIRAIVGTRDKRGEQLSLQAIRDAIRGRRGIGYMFPDGLTAGGVSGNAGQTTLPAGLGHLSEFATNEEIEKIKAAEQNAPKTITQVLNIQVGDKAMAIDDLVDCETGKGVEIVNTPQHKPPAGWDSPTQPGNEWERWTSGTKWLGSSISLPEASTPLAAAQAARDEAGSGAYTLVWGTPVFDNAFPHTGGNSRWIFEFKNPALPTSDPSVFYYAMDVTCTPGSSASCPVNFTIPWPADNKMQLSRGADGKFRYSTNEPAGDIIPAYTDNQHSKLDLCFGDGSGRKASIESAYDGGWLAYETDPDTGEPIGTYTKFNKDNVAVAKKNVDELPSDRVPPDLLGL